MGGSDFWNNYKGHVDETKGWGMEAKEGSGFDWGAGRVVGGKCRQL